MAERLRQRDDQKDARPSERRPERSRGDRLASSLRSVRALASCVRLGVTFGVALGAVASLLTVSTFSTQASAAGNVGIPGTAHVPFLRGADFQRTAAQHGANSSSTHNPADLAPVDAAPPRARRVRVLLYQGTDEIIVGLADETRAIRLYKGRELKVPGQGRLERWQPLGEGPWRVGRRIVRGQISVEIHRGKIRVLNHVGLEEYVASTVGGEMMASWPREALRAQAVAARTYVLHEAKKRRGRSNWDVRATAASQVYRGIITETPETRAAARATAHQVLTYEGEAILAVFHSTAGGRTATAREVWGEDRPYLRVVEVEDEADAPHTYWRTSMATMELAEVLAEAQAQVGNPFRVEVEKRTKSGRVKRLLVQGSRGSHRLERSSLRRFVSLLGLRSKLFEVRVTEDGFAFVGSGHGHGVGMSQWGARAMARRGESYQSILETFYPGTRLETWGPQRVALREQVSFGDDR